MYIKTSEFLKCIKRQSMRVHTTDVGLMWRHLCLGLSVGHLLQQWHLFKGAEDMHHCIFIHDFCR